MKQQDHDTLVLLMYAVIALAIVVWAASTMDVASKSREAAGKIPTHTEGK